MIQDRMGGRKGMEEIFLSSGMGGIVDTPPANSGF